MTWRYWWFSISCFSNKKSKEGQIAWTILWLSALFWKQWFRRKTTVYRTIKTSGGSAPLKRKPNKAFIKTASWDAPLLNVMPRFNDGRTRHGTSYIAHNVFSTSYVGVVSERGVTMGVAESHAFVRKNKKFTSSVLYDLSTRQWEFQWQALISSFRRRRAITFSK